MVQTLKRSIQFVSYRFFADYFVKGFEFFSRSTVDEGYGP
jgi:hypothetical protein